MSEEEPLSDLEDKFKLRRDDGVPDKNIVQEVFEENFDADIDELQRLTKMSKLDIGRIKGRVSRAKKRLEKIETEGKRTEAAPEKKTIFRTEADVNQILREVLESHPDITPKHINEVLSWADMTPGGLHPSHLAALLQSMKGIDSRTANLLATKYQLAVTKRQQETSQGPQIGLGWGYSPRPGPQFFSPGFPQQTTAFQGYGYGQPPGYGQPLPGLSRHDVDQMLKDKDREYELQDLKKERERDREDLKKTFQGLEAKLTHREKDVETIEVPVDADGKPCKPEDSVSTMKRTIPLGARGDDFLDKIIKMKAAGFFGDDKKLDAEAIKRIIDDARPKEDPTVKALETKIDAMNTKYEDLKDKMSDEEKKRLEDKITAMDNDLKGLRSTLASSGVNTPEGVLATGITTLGNRHPMTEMTNLVRELMTPGATAPPPGSAQAEAAKRTPILKALSEKGLVTTVRERVRGSA